MVDSVPPELAPYVGQAQADRRGEIEMLCPLHSDTRRSASMNLEKGVWFCHAGCGGGSLRRLIDSVDTFIPVEGRNVIDLPSFATVDAGPEAAPTDKDVKQWHRQLIGSEYQLSRLKRLRGITETTARKARLGVQGRNFKIPVFSPERSIWNVRTYDPSPGAVRRKIWSVKGMGAPRLYPVGILRRVEPGTAIMVCEGEWDTLLALQCGYLAITRTGAAKVWSKDWTASFAGLRVFMCHDRDTAGQDADRLVGAELAAVAEYVRYCQLPYEVRPKHGKDLSDYLLEEADPFWALGELLDSATTQPQQED